MCTRLVEASGGRPDKFPQASGKRTGGVKAGAGAPWARTPVRNAAPAQYSCRNCQITICFLTNIGPGDSCAQARRFERPEAPKNRNL